MFHFLTLRSTVFSLFKNFFCLIFRKMNMKMNIIAIEFCRIFFFTCYIQKNILEDKDIRRLNFLSFIIVCMIM